MKNILTSIFFFCMFSEAIYSQSLAAPSNIIISLEVDQSNGIIDPILLDSTALLNLTYILKVEVVLTNIEDVLNLHLKALKNNNSIFDESIPITLNDFQENSYSYHREGDVIYLIIGSYQGNITDLVVEAYSEGVNGVISSISSTN